MTTKEKLIQVTAKLIREKGIAATGIAELVEISAVPKGSIYHHFPGGKDDLIIAAIQNFKDLMSAAFKASLKGKSTAKSGLTSILDYYIDSLEKSNFRNGCPLAIVAMESSGNNDLINNTCKEVMDYWVDNLTSYFKYKGSNAGRNEAIEFITRLEGSLIMCQIYNDTKSLSHLKKQLSSIINE